MRKDKDARVDTLLDNLDMAILIMDPSNGMIHYANRHAEMNNCFPSSGGGPALCIDLSDAEWLSVYIRLKAECRPGSPCHIMHRFAKASAWTQISAYAVSWAGLPVMLVTALPVDQQTATDIYFNQKLNLPNSRELEDDINFIADVETVALLYFEIPHLRTISNLYGWDKGDYLLQQIRDWMLTSEHEGGVLYYVGNGAFASLGHNTTLMNAKRRAQEILQRFDKPWKIHGDEDDMPVYCSIKLGIVYGKYVRNEMRSLLSRTIMSIQDSSKYAIYDEKTDQAVKKTISRRNDLINCVRNGMQGFEVYYQPIVNMKTNQWVAVEALCRWTAPDGERVPPSEFIHMAEQLGLIARLDAWVHQTALQQCVMLKLDQKEFMLDINFSSTQKINDTFIDDLCGTIAMTGFPSHKVNLEITENAKVLFDDETLLGLARLSKSGITLSIDDFGIGYSSYENLYKIPAGFIKTEKMVLDDIVQDECRQYTFSQMVDLAKHLDIGLIAEGVETESQRALLHGCDVEYAQGYLFSQPLSYSQLEENLYRFV